MASIEKRGDSYRITVSAGYDLSGKKVRETLTYKPKATTPRAIEKELAAAALDFEKQVKEGKYLDGEKLSFEKFVEEYWRPQWAVKNLTLSCQEDYYDKIRRHAYPAFRSMKIARIMPLHIQTIIEGMSKRGLAPRTIKRAIVPINSVFTYAFRLRLIQENPVNRCELPKIKRNNDIHYFTVDQANHFLDFVSAPYQSTHRAHDRVDDTGKPYSVPEYTETHTVQFQFRVLFDLALNGSFRRGELIALQWRDIDFNRSKITVRRAVAKTKQAGLVLKEPKTERGNRVVTMPAESMNLLREWKRLQQEHSLQIGLMWKGKRGKEYDLNHVFIQLDTGEMMYVDTPTRVFRNTIKRYNSMIDAKIKDGTATEEDKLPAITLHDLRHTSATLLISEGMDIETLAARMGHSHPSVTLDIYGHALPENDEKAAKILENLFKSS